MPGRSTHTAARGRRNVHAAQSLLARLQNWWDLKHVCAWCQPMRRMSGNPFARKTTHGICPDCFALKQRELAAMKSEIRNLLPCPNCDQVPQTRQWHTYCPRCGLEAPFGETPAECEANWNAMISARNASRLTPHASRAAERERVIRETVARMEEQP